MKIKIKIIAAEPMVLTLKIYPFLTREVMQWKKKETSMQRFFLPKEARRGFNAYEAKKVMRDRNHFGCMMVECGDADAMISGLAKNYPDTIRPALQIIGTEEGVKKIAGMYLMLTKKGPLFLADTTVNFNPTAEELAEITLMVAKEVRQFQYYSPYCHAELFQFWQQQFTGSKIGCRSKENSKGKNAFADSWMEKCRPMWLLIKSC